MKRLLIAIVLVAALPAAPLSAQEIDGVPVRLGITEEEAREVLSAYVLLPQNSEGLVGVLLRDGSFLGSLTIVEGRVATVARALGEGASTPAELMAAVLDGIYAFDVDGMGLCSVGYEDGISNGATVRQTGIACEEGRKVLTMQLATLPDGRERIVIAEQWNEVELLSRAG
jgi:hypothetical protein